MTQEWLDYSETLCHKKHYKTNILIKDDVLRNASLKNFSNQDGYKA